MERTSIRLRGGFVDLVAIIDGVSRYVLSCRVSNTLDVSFCLEALEEALAQGKQEIVTSDQGSQLMSREWTGRLQQAGVGISRDGMGRMPDTIFVEGLWRAVTDEEVDLTDSVDVSEAIQGIRGSFSVYTTEQPPQALSYLTPAEAHVNRGEEFPFT